MNRDQLPSSGTSGELRGTNRFCAACLVTPMLATDLGPGRAGPAGLVDEVPDQVVGVVGELLGDEHGVGEVGQRVAVRVRGAHRGDEVVETYG